jgi:hypothetical protein
VVVAAVVAAVVSVLAVVWLLVDRGQNRFGVASCSYNQFSSESLAES